MLTTCLMLFLTYATDPHSYGEPAKVATTHISLDLALDFEQKVMSGQATLTLTYGDAKADTLHLDAAQLTIDAIHDPEGNKLPFMLGEDKPFLGRNLAVKLGSNQPEKVVITYKTDPGAKAVQWLDPVQTTSKKLPFLFTQSQAILARTWIPCQDSPGVRVTYDATIRVPKGIIPVMSAEHGNHDVANGIFRFKMPHAIPPYLIALAAGELEFKAISDRAGVYAEPAVLEAATREFSDIEKMIQVTEKLYGTYAWDRWDIIVLPPSFPFGGMENPRLTFATPTILAGDRSLVSLLAHELAHSWSGNLVTNANWDDFWLNEGFTTYIERRIVEALYGKDVAQMQWLLGQRDLRHSVDAISKHRPKDTALKLDLTGRDPDDGMTDIAYEKGANFLRVLEEHFGRDGFDNFIKAYFTENSFKNMTTERFLTRLKKELFKGDEAAWKSLKVDLWVFEPGLPGNIIVPQSDHFEKTKAAAKAFVDNGNLSGVQKESWITTEWLDFLNSLPRNLTAAQLDQLDKAFRFTKSGNSEIKFAWLAICIPSSYEPAYAPLEQFLTSQGRRKFLRPLYAAMMANPKTVAWAHKIYKQARAGYHPISSDSIDEIVK